MSERDRAEDAGERQKWIESGSQVTRRVILIGAAAGVAATVEGDGVASSSSSASGGGPLPFVDVWRSTPKASSVTDWGPIMNTLISAGHKRLYFGEHDFPFRTQINLSNTSSVVFEGAGGASGVLPATVATRLIWTARGGTSPFNLNGINGFYGCDLGIFYSDGLFTGRLFDCQHAYQAILERCRLGSVGNRFSAFSCVSMRNAVNCTLRDCAVGGDSSSSASTGGGGYCVSGIEAAGDVANVVVLDNCILGRARRSQVSNPFEDWIFRNVTWEVADSPHSIISTLGITASFEVVGGWLGDSTGSVHPFYQSAKDTWNAKFDSLWGQLSNTPFFTLLGAGTIAILDCPLARNDNGPVVDLGDIAAGAVAKTVTIRGGGWNTNTEAILHRAGHRLDIAAVGGNCKTVERLGLAGHENLSWQVSDPCIPTIKAQAALGSGGSAEIRGNDRAGIFYLSPGKGATAGVLATIKFGSPYEAEQQNSQTSNYGADIALMDIWPIRWQGAGPSNLAAAWAAQVSAYYPSNNKDAVQVEAVNAPTGLMVFGYRVIQL